MPEFSKQHLALFKKLKTPALVQDFLNAIPINHESDGVQTVKSPLRTLETNSAHCMEGALLGAYILSLHGHRPLLMLLKTKRDFDHVVVPFKVGGYWGALSKTNHASLRYRDPVYKTLRELALSYFHEYFTDDGKKTLRAYSAPLSLRGFEADWPTASENLWGIDEALDRVRMFAIAPPASFVHLRKADTIERETGKRTEW
jgi:hypothetical protein